MKKFLIVFLMLLPCLVGAQERLAQVVHPGIIGAGLIREYRYPATIGYVETDGEHRFVYNDGSQTIAEVKIDPKYHVSDMEVLDNYLYFCGQNVDLLRGFVGWFKIEGFFAGGAIYNIYDQFDFLGQQALNQQDMVIDFHDLCAFRTVDGSRRLMLAAETQYPRGCVVSLVEQPGSAMWRYEVGVSSELSERIERICVTDSHVVTVGTVFDPLGGISLRAFDPDQSFASVCYESRIQLLGSDDVSFGEGIAIEPSARPLALFNYPLIPFGHSIEFIPLRASVRMELLQEAICE